MQAQDVLPNVVLVFVVLSYALGLVAVVWGLYIAYLLTKALRKYLRS